MGHQPVFTGSLIGEKMHNNGDLIILIKAGKKSLKKVLFLLEIKKLCLNVCIYR